MATGDQLRSFSPTALYLATVVDGEIIGGLQAVVGPGAALPYRSVWPKVDVGEACAAHVTILALGRQHRGMPGLFWPLCVELWHWCDGRGIGTILMEATPATLFDDPRQVSLDRAVDGINDRWGRGTVTAAVAAKVALDHGRIPFGRPTELR